MEDQNWLAYKKNYPDAEKLLHTNVKTLSEIKDDALYVLDTNVLLMPYTSSKTSLDEIKNILKALKDKQCLYVPGQVLREFVVNRPEKIKNVFADISKKLSISNIPFFIENYPLLEDEVEYQELIKIQEEVENYFKQHKKILMNIKHKVKEWAWNDPLSRFYKTIFLSSNILDPDIDEEMIKHESERRMKYNLPPAYKDKSKSINSDGDLIIWLTILKLAEEKKKDIVFVSNDAKSDWFHIAEKQSLFPRFELQYEFQTKAPDYSFHIIKFSEFLSLLEAPEEVIEEIKFEEYVSENRKFVNHLTKAITNKKIISFHYNGGKRIVEPHCFGITTGGNLSLRGYQIGGASASGKIGWKMFDISQATNISILDETFNGPRPGYKKGDKGMSHIYCEL